MRKIYDRINEGLTEPQKNDLRKKVMKAAGVSKATYYRYLNGENHDQRIGIAIASYLNLTVDQVLDPAYPITMQHQIEAS